MEWLHKVSGKVTLKLFWLLELDLFSLVGLEDSSLGYPFYYVIPINPQLLLAKSLYWSFWGDILWVLFGLRWPVGVIYPVVHVDFESVYLAINLRTLHLDSVLMLLVLLVTELVAIMLRTPNLPAPQVLQDVIVDLMDQLGWGSGLVTGDNTTWQLALGILD